MEKKARNTGLIKGRLTPFCSGHTDSMAIDDGCISSFQSACMEDLKNGKYADVQALVGSICIGDEGGGCD